MASSPINVPNVPGVPSVNFASAAGAALSFLTADAVGIFAGAFGIQLWGIYSGFAPIVLCDNVLSVDYRNSWAIGDYPIEQGGFQSYDKVNNPFDVRVAMSCGGSIARRAAFLASIEAIAGTTDLYNVVTPEKVFLNCNVNRVDYARSADRGNGLITVQIGLTEIRVSEGVSSGQADGAGNTSNASEPGSQPQSNSGAVQPQAATPAQTSALPAYTPPPAAGHALN